MFFMLNITATTAETETHVHDELWTSALHKFSSCGFVGRDLGELNIESNFLSFSGDYHTRSRMRMNGDPLPDIREIGPWVCVNHGPDPVYRFIIGNGQEIGQGTD